MTCATCRFRWRRTNRLVALVLALAMLYALPTAVSFAAPQADITEFHQDASRFTQFQFDQVLRARHLASGPVDSLGEVSDSVLVEFRAEGDRIADSLVSYEPEVDRLYLQAYLGWLLVQTWRSVERDDLINAVWRLAERYPNSAQYQQFSRMARVGRLRRIGLDLNCSYGRGWPTKGMLNAHGVFQLDVSARLGKMRLQGFWNTGKGKPAVLQYSRPDWYDEIPPPESWENPLDRDTDYGIHRLGLRMGYEITRWRQWTATTFAGVSWTKVSPPFRLVESAVASGRPSPEESARWMPGPHGALRLSYNLGRTFSRSEEKLDFLGILRSNDMSWLELFAEVTVDRTDARYLGYGRSWDGGVRFGLSVVWESRPERRWLDIPDPKAKPKRSFLKRLLF